MNWWVLRRRVHMSWLVAWWASGVVVGVWLAREAPSGWFFGLPWLVSGVAMGLSALYWRQVVLVPLAVVGGVIIGLGRGALDQAQLPMYEQLQGHVVTLSGVVREDVDQAASGEAVLRLSDVRYEGVSLPGALWVTTGGDQPAQRSDRVIVRGKVTPGFGNFAGTMWRAQLVGVERPRPGDVALAARDWFAGLVRHVVPEPEASLGLGYLLGQRRSLPPELAEALQIAGLTHVIVASGYNLTILVRLARRLFMRISRFSSLAAASGMVLSFVAVTGMSPSMARAGLVTGLSLLAWYYGRRFHPLVLLPLAACVTVLANPSYAWGDIGWQLSFAAFGGVMLVAPLLQAYFFGDKKPGVVRQIVGETVSAQVATLPILVVAFGQVSNVALVANLLVLPLVPLAMLLVFATGLGVLVWPLLGTALGAVTTWLLGYMVLVASWLAALPWAQSEVEVGWWLVVVYYLVLGAMCVYLRRSSGYDFRRSSIVD